MDDNVIRQNDTINDYTEMINFHYRKYIQYNKSDKHDFEKYLDQCTVMYFYRIIYINLEEQSLF